MEEISISIKDTPDTVYHIVPIRTFDENTDENGNYDVRNKEDFGGNAPYIHTTPTIEQMNIYLPLLKQLQDKEFYLLTIDVKKLNPEKITYVEFETRRYYHFWCALPKECYTKRIVSKDEQGNISF